MITVMPSVYMVGMSTIHVLGLESYLRDTGNEEFLEAIAEAREKHNLQDMEILSSFFAKLCYLALTIGHNENITRTRSIMSNIIGTIESGHGSVFEHCGFNFVLRNVSRVLTHELVRHRAGTAFSQQSGRYCRISEEGPGMFIPSCLADNPEAVAIFEDVVDYSTAGVQKLYTLLGINAENFTEKKILTSAIRRIAPTGSANEIGFSVNLRSIRHIIKMRTNRGAEEEIRIVFAKIAEIIQEHCPTILHGGKSELINDLPEWTFEPLHL